MIDRNDRLPVTRQARSLNVNRSSIYYMPKPITETDTQVVMPIDSLHGWPEAGWQIDETNDHRGVVP